MAKVPTHPLQLKLGRERLVRVLRIGSILQVERGDADKVERAIRTDRRVDGGGDRAGLGDVDGRGEVLELGLDSLGASVDVDCAGTDGADGGGVAVVRCCVRGS